jgi:hypothetical protein
MNGVMDMSQEELARLRAIAEEGRHAPLLGGWHMILWGVAMTAALLINWAVIERHLPWPAHSLAFSWFGIAILAWIASFMLGGRESKRQGAFTIGNRIERMVWILAGGFLSTLAVAIFLRAILVGGPEPWTLFQMMPPVAFGAYSVAIGASATAAHDRGALPYAWLALAFCAATTLLAGTSEQYLAAAAGLALVSTAYGLRQLRAEARAAG